MINIRPMTSGDVEAVADLTRQLGYDVTGDDVGVRYGRLAATAGSIALVAEDDDRIVGWISALNRVLLQWKPVLEIGGLVIEAGRRGEGIGGLLVDSVAQWARNNGHTTLFVRSNVVRESAHDFYPALGFVHWKTSHTYVMELE